MDNTALWTREAAAASPAAIVQHRTFHDEFVIICATARNS
jgi:hypothetical protein